ncbi:MAG TPA: peptidoglycan DD-metalloendopeptidase family protein [Natronosporangium sp.]|nr:peptidoglycan DD-metalloendopeptidase family protein [Natronosporangium sp.]
MAEEAQAAVTAVRRRWSRRATAAIPRPTRLPRGWLPLAGALAAVLCCCSLAAVTAVLGPLTPVADLDRAAALPVAGCAPEGGAPSTVQGPGRDGVPAAADPTAGFDAEQLGNAELIVRVGVEEGIPARGWVIAVATAMQESGLRNLPHLGDNNDHDSLGLFQQRPSQGWGTPEQLMDPVYATRAFYRRLVAVDGWESMPLWQAAQAVQRSAEPLAYARHEAAATALVAAIAAGNGWPGDVPVVLCPPSGPWTPPVTAPVVSGFRTAQRPGHDGVDLGAARGTPVVAASAGTVTVVRCNVVPAGYGCDRDGSPAVRGCGWYVDLAHPGAVTTRYCHFGSRPPVRVGQPVLAGQVIGQVGSSGNSSGPHLHFEVHVGGQPVDPVEFMRRHGAPLGGTAP